LNIAKAPAYKVAHICLDELLYERGYCNSCAGLRLYDVMKATMDEFAGLKDWDEMTIMTEDKFQFSE